MNTIPDRIFLQWFGDESDPCDDDDILVSEVTWNLERVFDADIEYTRANALPAVQAQLNEAVALLERFMASTPAKAVELMQVGFDARAFLDKVTG